MKLTADLHVHSKYSIATSGEADLPHFYLWAGIKGLNVVATGDLTHPKWFSELKENLKPNGAGLFSLKDVSGLRQKSEEWNIKPEDVWFILSSEISTVYKKGDKTRKIHSVILFDSLEASEKFTKRLSKIGNVTYDGRPMLGLDVKDLLSITLEVSPDAMFIPAHIWTPWFSVLGSKSGFDSIEECFEDLTPHITALETGLSSDPAMNWRLSGLDKFSLVSNSDAHSPANLGREANLFECSPSFSEIKNALRNKSKKDFLGTVEFFPEEGKYHNDGHRNCNVNLEPGISEAKSGICPVCGKPMTIGVLHRVLELADRPEGARPEQARDFKSLIPLPQLLSECFGTAQNSKKIREIYAKLIKTCGPEFPLLMHTSIDELKQNAGEIVAEAVKRMREGRVERIPGFDGEYGKIRVFDDLERSELLQQDHLFALSGKKVKALKSPSGVSAKKRGRPAGMTGKKSAVLNDTQSKILSDQSKRIMVIAGPGTGKTKTLTEKAATLISQGGKTCAVTFTRKAARELSSRLGKNSGWTGTIHSLALEVLRTGAPGSGSPGSGSEKLPSLISPRESIYVLKELFQTPDASKAAREISLMKGTKLPEEYPVEGLFRQYSLFLEKNGLMDFDDIIIRAFQKIRTDESCRSQMNEKFDHLFVDEFQDINRLQYFFIKELSSLIKGVLFVIGDPEQSIYKFRGSEPKIFDTFQSDNPDTAVYNLEENYRSGKAIIRVANSFSGSKRVTPVLETAGAVYHQTLESPLSEGIFIAHEITRHMAGLDMVKAQELEAKGRKDSGLNDLGFNDFAILTRTEKQQSVIRECLEQEGIPYRLRGAASFLDSQECRTIILLLKMIIDPGHPLTSLLGKDLAIPTLIKKKPENYRNDVPGLVRDFAATTGWKEPDELLSLAVEHPHADDFLDTILYGREDELVSGKRKVPSEAVSLLTMHSSKGLEFPVVFIAGAEEGLTPIHGGDTDEEKRLFYVAITRASKVLYLTDCRSRGQTSGFIKLMDPGQFDEFKPLKRKRGAVQLNLFPQEKKRK